MIEYRGDKMTARNFARRYVADQIEHFTSQLENWTVSVLPVGMTDREVNEVIRQVRRIADRCIKVGVHLAQVDGEWQEVKRPQPHDA